MPNDVPKKLHGGCYIAPDLDVNSAKTNILLRSNS